MVKISCWWSNNTLKQMISNFVRFICEMLYYRYQGLVTLFLHCFQQLLPAADALRAVVLSLTVLVIHREVPLLWSSLPAVGMLFMQYSSFDREVWALMSSASTERDCWEAVSSGTLQALSFFVGSRLDRGREWQVVSALAGRGTLLYQV